MKSIGKVGGTFLAAYILFSSLFRTEFNLVNDVFGLANRTASSFESTSSTSAMTNIEREADKIICNFENNIRRNLRFTELDRYISKNLD